MSRTTPEYADGWYWSLDGLRLHYRDYAPETPGPARPVVLCLPGLTRNARDFDVLAPRLADKGWRVIAVDLRGRSESAYAKDALTYVPLTYLQDIGQLLAAAGIDRFVPIGTSLGGLLTMLLGATQREHIAGAVINDIGPDVEAVGLDRVRGLVGRGGSWPTWMHAARDLGTTNAGIYPRWRIDDWLGFAHRLCRVSGSGRIVFDYDPRIAEPFRLPASEAGFDMWTALDALADVPVLSVRGATSDIFTKATQVRMVARLPKLRGISLAQTGHAPTLDEPASVKAIEALLDEVK